MKATYCSRCGGPVEMRTVAGRSRDVCPACGTIFYENPLPAAAALVLNEQREVLLVKRRDPPNKGMWCLPTGFAERGETIRDAALRELEEETGVAGRITRLIDADSWTSVFYGTDVLVVTFEVEKTGGTEVAGDDAEALAYFPIDKLPPLAFPSNEKTVRLCSEIHRDEWAIRDSFLNLETGSGAQMLSNSLVSFVSEHVDYVARLWLADVRSSSTTSGYRRLDPEEVLASGASALALLGRWLEGEGSDEGLKAHYRELGARRQGQGVQLHEVLSALMLLKKHIWTYARSQGVWQRPVDTYRMMELQSRFAVFFDKAVFNTARGFGDASGGV